MKPKRECIIAARLTVGEKARLDFVCEQLGLGPSSLIRHLVAKEIQKNSWNDHDRVVESVKMDQAAATDNYLDTFDKHP